MAGMGIFLILQVLCAKVVAEVFIFLFVIVLYN